MRKYIYLIPIAIVILAVWYSFYVVNTTDIIPGIKQYFGIIFTSSSIILTFMRKDFWIYLTGIALLLGTINVIAFTPVIESYSFGFGFDDSSKLIFKIQPFSFFILALYLVINYKVLLALIRGTSKS